MSNKEDIIPRNKEGRFHGLCITYYHNGNVWSKERYVNGKRHGIYEKNKRNNELWYKEYYKNGELVYYEFYGNTNKIRFYI